MCLNFVRRFYFLNGVVMLLFQLVFNQKSPNYLSLHVTTWASEAARLASIWVAVGGKAPLCWCLASPPFLIHWWRDKSLSFRRFLGSTLSRPRSNCLADSLTLRQRVSLKSRLQEALRILSMIFSWVTTRGSDVNWGVSLSLVRVLLAFAPPLSLRDG